MSQAIIAEKFNDFNKFIESVIIPRLTEFHINGKNYIDSLESHYKVWHNAVGIEKEPKKIFSITAELHKVLEKELHLQNEFLSKQLPFSIYKDIEDKLSSEVEHLEKLITVDQETEHFSSLDQDTRLTVLQKKIKTISFSIGKFLNNARKKNVDYAWKRNIPFENMFKFYLFHNYQNSFLKSLEAYIEVIGSNYSKLLEEQKVIDSAFIKEIINSKDESPKDSFIEIFKIYFETISVAKKNLDEGLDVLISEIQKNLSETFESLKRDYDIVGTIQLPSNKFSFKIVNEKINIQNDKLGKSKLNYKNYIAAIFDRKEFYEDLSWFSSSFIGTSFNIKKYGDKFLNEAIEPILEDIISEILSTIKKVESPSQGIKQMLDSEKTRLTTILDHKTIPSLVNKVSSNNLVLELDNYLENQKKNLDEFDKEYNFVRPSNLIYRIKKDQIKEFSPKEILSPIVIGRLSDSIKKIKDEFDKDISKLNSTIIGLGQIVEYNLDSSQFKLEEETDNKNESVIIARDGLLRAVNKSEDYSTEITKIFSNTYTKLASEVNDILIDLLSLSNIDRLITIKIQVTKEKALRDAKERINLALEKLKQWSVYLKEKILSYFIKSKERIIGIKSIVGLSNVDLELSEAMADYFLRMSESLEKLPFVYQRLFSNDQIKDERIFIGREKEASKLDKAIHFWLNKQISSVMLIGEKGSGTSSFINVTLKKFNLESQTLRKEFTGTIYTEEALLNAFKSILSLQTPHTVDELIDKINQFEERKIIVIENVEDFFLKIVTGFEALNKLLDIITATNNKILWITTCNIHAWDYLRKVLNINDYFIFNIKMTELTEALIERIVLSRHNISGYDLEFLPGKNTEKQKSYIKLTEEEKQNYLRKEYFEKLSKLSSNNIAVTLFLWLRSIKNADNEKILISSEIEIDFSFLKALSDQKLFSLMNILLHDGLTIEEHSLIFNMNNKSTKLLFATLEDDGIIFKKDDVYRINFQLYKPIISLLKDKNILH